MEGMETLANATLSPTSNNEPEKISQEFDSSPATQLEHFNNTQPMEPTTLNNTTSEVPQVSKPASLSDAPVQPSSYAEKRLINNFQKEPQQDQTQQQPQSNFEQTSATEPAPEPKIDSSDKKLDESQMSIEFPEKTPSLNDKESTKSLQSVGLFKKKSKWFQKKSLKSHPMTKYTKN